MTHSVPDKPRWLNWPVRDEICYGDIVKGLPALDEAVSRCQQHRTCIQAGGNAGLYPIHLAKTFGLVYTLEPEPVNFDCLIGNIEAIDNIEAWNAAVGAEEKQVGLTGWAPNCGSYRVVPGAGTHMVTIDSLQAKNVDLIQLDIEGSELDALYGASETIERDLPVIMVERRGHGADPDTYLKNIGYRCVYSSDTDSIYEF